MAGRGLSSAGDGGGRGTACRPGRRHRATASAAGAVRLGNGLARIRMPIVSWAMRTITDRPEPWQSSHPSDAADDGADLQTIPRPSPAESNHYQPMADLTTQAEGGGHQTPLQSESQESELQRLRSGAARDKQALQAARSRCEELQADLAAQREYSARALANAMATIDRLRNEHAWSESWQAERRALEAKISALITSRSWRITAPLRTIGARARAGINRLRPKR